MAWRNRQLFAYASGIAIISPVFLMYNGAENSAPSAEINGEDVGNLIG
jgi:hypothetical protein